MNAYVPYVLDDETRHPPGYNRLFNTLSAIIDVEHHPVWGMTAVMLTVYVANRNPKFDETVRHASAKNEVNYLCDLLLRTTSE